MLIEEVSFEFLEQLLRKMDFNVYALNNDSFLFEHEETETIINLPSKTQKRHFDMIKNLVVKREVVDELHLENL
ncbi:hypothetical protein ACOI1C_13975 [Bacillus sp. DJP31]|uniref:hypothetical protein n=1 Tax=Bacillus sp. DJP31 TaxID=3409789 RepID=UPI003BB51B27